MTSEKICQAIATVVAGEAIIDGKRVSSSATSFGREAGCAVPTPIVIHPDEDGVLWYWTPEPHEPME